MDSNYIQILKNQPLISVIMSYYSYTHRYFLYYQSCQKDQELLWSNTRKYSKNNNAKIFYGDGNFY